MRPQINGVKLAHSSTSLRSGRTGGVETLYIDCGEAGSAIAANTGFLVSGSPGIMAATRAGLIPPHQAAAL
jgi:hypothetical protein